MNQTALSLGYIALKRIRALEEPTTRLPSNPLLRHLGHIKILAACVEQVGPEEIIEYEINQDVAVVEPHIESLKVGKVESDDESCRAKTERKETANDVFEARYTKQARPDSPPTESLFVIREVEEDEGYGDVAEEALQRRSFYVTNLSRGDLEEGEYSMDELYDEYNTREEDWETASNDSDDAQLSHIEDVPRTTSETPALRVYKDIDTDSEADSDEEEFPPTPPNVVVSRSPPLDINTRHPITNELQPT